MRDKKKKLSKNQEKKQVIVAELVEKIGKAKALVFSNYQGMTHRQIEDLKKALKKTNAELVVAKNTLLRRALAEKDHKLEDSALQNPTITLLAYDDPIAPLKALAKSIKALNLPQIKFGIFSARGRSASGGEGWDLLAENEVVRLSTLPSRDVLIGQVVGGLKSPLYGLHRALSWNMQKLVMTLQSS